MHGCDTVHVVFWLSGSTGVLAATSAVAPAAASRARFLACVSLGAPIDVPASTSDISPSSSLPALPPGIRKPKSNGLPPLEAASDHAAHKPPDCCC